MMDDFRQWIGEKRLTGLIYYSWIGDPPFDVDRCWTLIRSGELNIAPIAGQ
jgi:hypothetical protein